MPPTSRYLSRILNAASKTVTAAQLANVLDVPLPRAADVLRYWERAGYLLPQMERSLSQRRRVKARYSLTAKGQAALYDEQQHEATDYESQSPQQQTGD